MSFLANLVITLVYFVWIDWVAFWWWVMLVVLLLGWLTLLVCRLLFLGCVWWLFDFFIILLVC